jgi:ATP-dependent DNA helicase RecG
MVFDSLDKIYQARLDKILDAPLVGRFMVGKTGKTLIDSGLIEKTIDLMEPFLTVESDELKGKPSRDKIWFYPFEAIRELLVNALAHRDWTRCSDVEMTGYFDRIEIISPGSLPNSMTVEKIIAGQRSPRNHIIVDVLRDYGYVDARGMGVRVKVIPALESRDAGYAYETTEDYVKIKIEKTLYETDGTDQRRENIAKVSVKRAKNVGKTSVKILDACRERDSITISELASLIGVTERSVERNIRKLQENKSIKRVGGRKEGRWEVLYPR